MIDTAKILMGVD